MKKVAWITYLILVASLLIFLTYKVGFNQASFIVWVGFSCLLAIPFYFQAQEESEASSTEKFAAKVWVYFRRFICLIGILLIAAGGINILLNEGPSLIKKIGIFIGCIICCSVLYRLGWYGTKANNYFQFEQSLEASKKTHEKRKNRYDL